MTTVANEQGLSVYTERLNHNDGKKDFIMNIVIDIQGLRDVYNQFIPKEVAVLSIQSEYFNHWIAKPPHGYDELPPNVQNQNMWLSENIHGIKWYEGDTSLSSMKQNLKRIASQAKRIFTRGSEKASYLIQLTGCFVINLEEEDEVPSFHYLPRSDAHCMYHCVLNNKSTYKCALNNATRIKAWLSHSERIGSLWEYRTTTSWHIGMSTSESEEEKPHHEQSPDSAISSEYKKSYSGRIPSRSDPEGVDETDSLRD